jgi:hypothetical protein
LNTVAEALHACLKDILLYNNSKRDESN